MYVPFDPDLLQNLWDSIMNTIASTSNLGFYLFTFIAGMSLVIAIVNKYV